MRNPLRSEPEAFRFLLLTIGYFLLIVIGAKIDTWVGVAVFVALTLLAGYFAFFRGRADPAVRTATVASPAGESRILVIANETVGGRVLTDLIHEKSTGSRANVLVVAPALVTPLQRVTSDEDPGRVAAQERLDATLSKLQALGVDAQGEIGDVQPLQAIEDALRTFGPDEIIISTHPEGRSHWLETGVVTSARERFAVPVTHVVVDLDAEREDVR
jgi:GABA permease